MIQTLDSPRSPARLDGSSGVAAPPVVLVYVATVTTVVLVAFLLDRAALTVDRALGSASWRSRQVVAVAFSGSGERLAAAGKDTPIYVWSTAMGEEVASINARGWRVARWSLALSPRGDLVAAGLTPPLAARFKPYLHITNVSVWQVQTRNRLWRSSDAHPLSMKSSSRLVFSADGGYLAGGLFFDTRALGAGHLKVWNVRSGKLELRLARAVNGVSAVAFSPQGTIAAQPVGLLRKGRLALWDVSTGKSIQTYRGCEPALYLAFSRDGHSLAGGGAHEICLWDTQGGKTSKTSRQGKERLVALDFSTAQAPLVALAREGVSVWDSDGGAMTRKCAIPQLVSPAQLSSDGKMLAFGDPTRPVVHLWDVQACKELRTFTMQPEQK